ncbi:AraC family transcriptional regulator [Oceanobacillus jeddahense]|uniref:GyrI-like domain-containing protein n=1 Tax=Oceanobacillus jeddahense TaxID=1462527 RepID=A0ABY5JW46_9BACI|nr:GyrI-like domain-containing protein [Oceanobacillus jeddahense]UUI04551.1 GyrI-like domain-containing protein [Oceanobacillus jeddahense]
MKIEQISDLPIVYMRRTGAYGEENQQLMAAFKHWMTYNNTSQDNLLTDSAIILGIIHDDPALVSPEACRYDTAMVLSAQQKIDDACVQKGILQGGNYAVFTIDHTAEAMNRAWQVVFTELTEYDYQLDEARPILERYTKSMLEKHVCEICLPVQGKA